MVNKSRQPSPHRAWIATVAATAIAAVAMALCVWQLGRAQEKQQWMDLRASRASTVALGDELRWSAERSAQSLDQQRVLLTGRWIMNKSIALDNRLQDGRAGVHVLTPLLLNDQSVIWVNRGWMARLPGAGALQDPPRAADPVALQGVAVASAMQRKELTTDPKLLRAGNLWQNFDWNEAAEWMGNSNPGRHVWPVIVWQTSDNADGLKRRLPEVSSDVPKHLGYALQWAFLCVAALFFAWRLRPKRSA